MPNVYLDASAVGYQQRAARLLVGAALVFGALLLRLAHLQIIEGDSLHEASVRNFVRTEVLSAERGTVYDRHGRILAVNRPTFDLYVTPAEVKDVDALLQGLRGVLTLDELDVVRLRERIVEPRGMWRQQPIRVEQDMDRRQVAQAESLRAQVDGLSILVRFQREYPFGEVGAHLLGYLGRPTQDELNADERYHKDSMIGRFGIERRFEGVLSGRDGFERHVVDARGARVDSRWAEKALEGQVTRRAPERGLDVQLTVDAEVQRILVKAMEKYESGAAVVLDPRDGSILGMVSKPSFDPNIWSGRLTPEAKRAVDESPYDPMMDKSVHSYFPGSIYKVVTAVAGLEEGILDPNLPIESPGRYMYGNRAFHCHKRSGHGQVDLEGALAASADVYFYKLGEQLGIDTLAVYGRRFGFGVAPGLGINGESAGTVPTRAFHEKHTAGGFQHGLALSTAIGQGDVRTSPVQIAMAYGALANGGTVFAPNLVARILRSDGTEVSRTESKVLTTIGAKPAHLSAINRGLERVVNDPELGTGLLAAVDGGRVAGKTGTAQVRQIIRGNLADGVKRFRDRDHAWFAGYAPYESPRIVVVVFLEHGGSGGKDAAPVARQIIEAFDQRIEPLFTAQASSAQSVQQSPLP